MVLLLLLLLLPACLRLVGWLIGVSFLYVFTAAAFVSAAAAAAASSAGAVGNSTIVFLSFFHFEASP